MIACFHGSTGICACLMDLYYSEPVSKYLLQYDKQDRTWCVYDNLNVCMTVNYLNLVTQVSKQMTG